MTTRSATGFTLAEEVLELSALLGSVVPLGGATLAVFAIVPTAVPATVPEMLSVMLPPAGKLATVPLTVLPLTLIVAGQLAPPEAPAQLAATEPILLGTVSAKLAPFAALGPALRMTTV